MKKILPFLLFLVIAQTQAQISVNYKGEPVKDGATLTFTAQPDPFGTSKQIYVKSEEPVFINTSDKNVKLKIEVKCTEYQKLLWCGITGECQPPTNEEENREVTLKPGSKAFMRLESIFDVGDYSNIWAKITVYADGKRVVGFNENFVYPDLTSAITTAQTVSEWLSLTNRRTLTYHFAKPSALRTLTLYTTDGHMVLRTTIPATQGNVNLNNLSGGTYVATLTTAEGKLQSIKLVLR